VDNGARLVTKSQRLRHVSAEELSTLVPFADAVSSLERAFRELDQYSQHPRQHLSVGAGELLMMPASGPDGVGIKVLTLNESNPAQGIPLISGAYLLFAPGTLLPDATVDGAALTALRTAAVSALATKHLAREDAARLVVFGAGAQAAAHIAAMRAVRPIEHVTIVGTGSPRTHALRATVLASGLSCDLGAPNDVASADIVCTCTTSREAIFPAALVPDTAHVNAVGSYQPHVRELEAALLDSAQVVVETRASALAEAGDIVLAIGEGRLASRDIVELGEIICGVVSSDVGHRPTVFKSVGLALEDLVVARVAADRAARGMVQVGPAL
jgi:ornithine cyclodeaminase